jgi:hypothetical protein
MPTRQQIEDAVRVMEKKYFDLVWFARTGSAAVKDGNISMPGVVRVKMAYPEECARLSGEQGAWEHGFNSGCLAAFRLVLGLMGTKVDAQMAEDEFPFLDT